YQGAQTWDAKWQDLLAKQAAWEQNSFNSIITGLSQWDQAIAGLENDKLAYLNEINATEAQWLANEQLIQNAENGIRTTLQNTLNSIRAQENQLRSSMAGDPVLNSSFGDIDSLLASLQDSLDQHASLDTLAQSLGDFFQNQKNYADSKVDYWNSAKWQDGYATQIVNFAQQVGTSSVSCSNDFGSNGCSNIVQGNRGIYYQGDGSVLGWRADSSSLIYQSDVTALVGQGSYSSSATHEDTHFTYQCFSGSDFGGTCTNGHGGYRLNGEWCGNEWFFCGYTQVNNLDQRYSFAVNGNFNTAQIQNNNNIRNAIFGTYNLSFSSSPDAAQAASSVTPILQGTSVYLGGTALTSSNWFSLLGSTNQVEIQSRYRYADAAMQGNQDFWSGMSSQFSNLANTFLSLVNPLRDWESRSNQYSQEYNSKLQELQLAKQATSQNYDDQIAQMKAARDAWVTSVYGFQINGYNGVLDNADSQYRQGQQAWADEIQLFQQAELNWYLSAKDTLQQALSDPQSGEEPFQANAISQTNTLESLITNSESNTSQLYNTAVGLWDSYQYAASGNLVDQAILNKQNESVWNTQGAALSQSIADSFGRSQAYGTAALDASNRINSIITAMLGQPAQIVDNAELLSLQNQANLFGQNQTFWLNEISGSQGGFGFNGKASENQTLIDQYTAVRADISIASTLQLETVDQEKTFLNQASEYFNKSERYLALSEIAKSEGRFDESAYYMKLSSDQKSHAMSFLKEKYSTLGDTITTEVTSRALSNTRNSFLNYRDSLLHRNFKNSQEIAEQIKYEKNNVEGIIGAGQSYDQIQGMLQSAKNLIQQGSENKGAIESLLSYSQELATRDIGGSLLEGLTEMISSLESKIPGEITADFVTQQIAASQKEMEEKQSRVDELLGDMNSLLTNDNDLQALQTLMQGGAQSLNFAANSAVSQYLDQYSQKLQKENEERSASLQKNLFDSLINGEDYKYLRDAGYSFRINGDRISGYRQIQSGEVAIDGNAMKDSSYSAVLEYQYIQILTKFNPGNLRVDTLNLDSLNTTAFNASMVENVRDYLDSMQSQMEGMFAQFSDKTAELQQSFSQNQEIKEFQENEYRESKKETLANFQALDPSFKQSFQPTMGQTKEYHRQSGSYGFEEGSAQSQGNKLRSSFDGLGTGDKIFAGSRDLKGTVNVKGIPIEISYGKQDLLVLSSFSLDSLGYDFKLKGFGSTYTQDQLTTVNQKYSNYLKDVEEKIENQAKANDAEKESKGFIFTIMNGMNGGSGSMGQRFTQAVKSEFQSRMTGMVAEATGLPASFVGALVGGGSLKSA
ncbi:peptidase M23, partial [Leptospira sp. 201903070]|nr:peptidase M23 [Leptospira ainlahdjerensis]